MEAGQIIGGRLRVVRLIGSGGMGSVYEVEHVDLGDVYAVKQLNRELAGNEAMVRSFVKEAKRMRSLGNASGDPGVRHLVKLEDLETDPQYGVFIRMELIRGENLSTYRTQRGKFAFPEVVRIGSEIAMALGLAHRSRIVHCDVKPANILIEESTRRAVVTDFGISKRIRTESGDFTAPTDSVSGLTARYAAPEQVRADKIDQRADLYALGAVLYEMASGRRFLDEIKEEMPIGVKKAQAGWRPVLQIDPPIPPSFLRLLNDLLENDPEQRIADAGLVLERLSQCLIDFEHGQFTDDATQTRTPAPPVTPPTIGPIETPPTVLEEDEKRLQQLQAALASQLELTGELEGVAGALGIAESTWATLLAELRAGREAVDELERSGRVHDAIQSAEETNERLTQLLRNQTLTLRQHFGPRVAQIEDLWQALRQSAGQLLPKAIADQADDAVERLRTHVSNEEWASAADLLQRTTRDLESALKSARAQATSALEQQQRQLESAVDEWRRNIDGEPPIDIATIGRRSAALLEEDRLSEAIALTGEALRTLQTAFDAGVRAQRAQLEQLRQAVSDGFHAIDADDAKQAAATALKDAEQLTINARDAEQRQDWRAAIAAYEEVNVLLRAVSTRIGDWQRGEVDQLSEQLRSLLKQTLAASPPAAAAAQAARQLLARLPNDPGQARLQLKQATATLQDRLALAEHYSAAAEVKSAAHGAQERVSSLGIPKSEQQRAEQLMEAAAEAFKLERWQPAHELYREAFDAWVTTERAALERNAELKLAAQRQHIDGLLRTTDEIAGTLDALTAALGAESAGVAARAAASEIRQLAEREELESAQVRSLELVDQLRDEQQHYASLLIRRCEERLAELLNARDELAQLAGSLLPEEEATRLGSALSEAQQSIAENIPLRAWDLIAHARNILDNAQHVAETSAEAALRDMATHLASASSDWKRLDDTTPPVDIARATESGNELLRQGKWAAAVDVVSAALEQLRDAVGKRHQTLLGMLAEARAAAQVNQDAIDTELAAGLAAGELAAAAQLLQEARLKEQQGDLWAAHQAYRSAAAAFSGVCEGIRSWEAEQVRTLASDVEAKLAQAARLDDELAAPARKLGHAALALAHDDVRMGRQSLAAARDALSSVLAEAESYQGAKAQQQRAESTQRRVSPMRLRRAARRAAERQTKAATTTYQQRQWAVARDQYSAAADAWESAEKNPRRTTNSQMVLAGGAAVLFVAAGVAYVSAPITPPDESSRALPTPRLSKTPPLQPSLPPPKNAAPILTGASPPPDEALFAEIGSTLTFRVEAEDPEGYPLQYSWKVDDKPVGSDSPSFDWKVSNRAAVEVAISDGSTANKITRRWMVNLPPLAMTASPINLTSLRFQTQQKFEAKVQSELDAALLSYKWTVDGKTVADTPTFQFSAVDPALVRNKPVTITVAVEAPGGRATKRNWELKVTPPPGPRVLGVDPPTGNALTLEANKPHRFELTVAPPTTGQTLSFLFVANGKETQSSTPRFDLMPQGNQEYTVVAYARDNFGQVSEQKIWKGQARAPLPSATRTVGPDPAPALVRQWLEQYRTAILSRDVAQQKVMMKLTAPEATTLQKAVDAQCELSVSFGDPTIEVIAPDRVRAVYSRKDAFNDCNTLQPVSAQHQVTMEFRIVSGQAELVR